MSEIQITLSEACKLPQMMKNDKPASHATLWRWAKNGVRGVILEHVYRGGTILTTREAIERFLIKVNQRVPQKSSIIKKRRHSVAKARLAAKGL